MSADNDEVKRIFPARSRGGEWVRIGDEEYKIPPLAFISLQELGDRVAPLRGMKGIPSQAQMDAVIGLVHLAMRRNYPDLSLDELREMLDLGNYQAVFTATMRIAGLVLKPEAPAASGEAAAAIGTGSTQP